MNTNKGRDAQGHCVLEMIWSRMIHPLVDPRSRGRKGPGVLVLASIEDTSTAFEVYKCVCVYHICIYTYM